MEINKTKETDETDEIKRIKRIIQEINRQSMPSKTESGLTTEE